MTSAARALAAILVASATACAGGGDGAGAGAQPEHELLEDVDRPPVNFPVEPQEIGREELKPELPEGDVSAMVALVDGDVLRGRAEAEGAVLVEDERIEISAPQGDLAVLYRLPPAMDQPVPDLKTATLAVEEQNTPAGADESLTLSDAGDLLALGHVWTTSPTPLEVQLAEGFAVVQDEVRAADRGYTEVTTRVVTDGSVTDAVVGKPFDVGFRDARYTVFIEISHFFSAPESDAGQWPDEYILNVWAVRAG